MMAVFREHHFERLARLVGHPEWVGDPRFATREAGPRTPTTSCGPRWRRGRGARRGSRRARRSAPSIVAGPNHTAADLAADPHVAARDMLLEVPRPDGGRDMLVGNPVKLSRVAEGPLARFPRLGEHTEAVLRDTLGLGDDEIAPLRDAKVI